VDDPDWYREGLRFTCQRCGNCCRGAPGYVWVDDAEVAPIAAHLGLSVADCERRFLRWIPGRGRSLTERADFDCVFFDLETGCRIYPVRPRQCRTWPFWRGNLLTRTAWSQAAASCPGMDRGRPWPAVDLRCLADQDGLP
jgi:hypothetical protein